MYHSLSIHLLKNTWVVSSLGITTKATIHMANCFLCEFKFSFLLGKYLGMGLLDHTIRICLTFKETIELFSKVSVLFCSSINNA